MLFTFSFLRFRNTFARFVIIAVLFSVAVSWYGYPPGTHDMLYLRTTTSRCSRVAKFNLLPNSDEPTHLTPDTEKSKLLGGPVEQGSPHHLLGRTRNPTTPDRDDLLGQDTAQRLQKLRDKREKKHNEADWHNVMSRNQQRIGKRGDQLNMAQENAARLKGTAGNFEALTEELRKKRAAESKRT